MMMMVVVVVLVLHPFPSSLPSFYFAELWLSVYVGRATPTVTSLRTPPIFPSKIINGDCSLRLEPGSAGNVCLLISCSSRTREARLPKIPFLMSTTGWSNFSFPFLLSGMTDLMTFILRQRGAFSAGVKFVNQRIHFHTKKTGGKLHAEFITRQLLLDDEWNFWTLS